MIEPRPARTLLACAAMLALSGPALAARLLPDGTSTDAWTLGNGLRVVVRNVQGADAVAIVVGYPAGRDQDPPGREGFTELMAEVAFTAPAGDVPVRTRTDLDSQRPAGWNVQVERRRTEFAELATLQQFPGVLHQVAQRMAGVRVGDADVERARTALIERRRETVGADLGVELYVAIGQHAAGWDHAAMRRWMSGEGLAGLGARDLAPRIAEAYVPARAVLSLAGDFEGIHLRAFIESEFGAIPGGTPRGDAMPAGVDSGGALLLPHPRVDPNLGGAGIIAPALSDTTHPSFYMTMLLIGMRANGAWNEPGRPSISRFQYSILDDPDVVRLYPPALGAGWRIEHMLLHMNGLVNAYDSSPISLEQVQQVRTGVEWLLGGPLPRTLAAKVRTDRSVLYRLCSAAATRELWGGESFWTDYRARFDPERSAGSDWAGYLRDPNHQFYLMYEPPPREGQGAP